MKKITSAAIAGLCTLILGFSVVVAPSASAGRTCDVLGVCGRIIVSTASHSACTVRISNGWNGTTNRPAGTIRYLADRSGYKRDSKSYFKDTDGFYVNTNCTAKRYTSGTGSGITVKSGHWYKITDLNNYTLKMYVK